MNKFSQFKTLLFALLLVTTLGQVKAQVVLKFVPPNVSVACDAVPLAAQVAASAACLPVDIQLVETILNKTCSGNYTLNRTWTATDNCGSKSTATQILTVSDTKSPVIKFIDPLLLNFKNGDTLVMSCFNTPSFNAASATATDACDGNPKLVFKDNLVIDGNCIKDKFVVIMSCSWIATDDCGNKTEIQGYFKVIDNEAPLMTGVPKDITVECDKIPDPNLNPPVPVDKCDKFVKMTLAEVKTNGTCANRYQIKRTWTATDQCGNFTTAVQFVTVQDKTIPLIINPPKDIAIDLSAGQIVPLVIVLDVKDNCTLVPKIIFEEKVIDSGCEKYINRFWTVTDECNNAATHVQTITVKQNLVTPNNIVALLDSVCFVKDSVAIAIKSMNYIIPSGFAATYFLVSNGLVYNFNNNGKFFVFNAGDYSIHTLIHQSSLSSKFDNILKVSDLIAILNNECSYFDTKGVLVNVKNCYNEGCILPTLSKVLIADASCGSSDGYMILEVGTNSNAYAYSWLPNVSNSNVATGLKSGVYTINIRTKSDTTCQITKTFMVGTADGPQPKDIKTTPANCNVSDGTVTINGVATWTYLWPDGKNLIARTDLKTGTYAVTISDVNKPKCDNVISVFIGQANNLVLSHIIDNEADCKAANGKATINVSGGSGQYKYSWGASATKSNLAAGAYIVTVTDEGSGCQKDIHFVMNNKVSAAMVNIAVQDFKLKCAGDTTGFVKYTIQVDTQKFVGSPTIRIVDVKNKLFINGKLSAGKYCIIVYDGNKCIAGSDCFEITQPEPLIVHVISVNGDCKGGLISIKADGGVAPYTYVWADLPNQTIVTERTALANGFYTVNVKDSNQCNWNVSFTIKNKCTSVKKDTIYLNLLVNQSDSACVELELNFDALKTKYNLLFSTNTSLYGSWALNSKGCLKYNAGNQTGKYIDVIGVIANENNLKDTTCFIISIDTKVPNDCNIFADSSLTLKAKDCLSTVELCLNIPLKDINNFQILDNGLAINVPTEGCKSDSSFFYSLLNIPDKGLVGPYKVDKWTVNGQVFAGNFSTVADLVLLLNTWDITGLWTVNIPNSTIENKGKMQNYGALEITQISSLLAVSASVNSNIMYNGTLLNLSPGAHKIVVQNNILGCSDSLFLQVNCDTCTSQIVDFKPIKTKKCAELTEICVGIDFVTLADYIILDNSKPYANTLDSCSGGSTLIRLAVGVHDVTFTNKKTGCTEKTFGILIVCDSTFTSSIDTIVNVVMLNNTDSTCIDFASSIGIVDVIYNYCPQSSGNFVNFSFNQTSSCIKYTGIKVGGPEYACIVACNKSGVCDTTIFKITCIKDTSVDNIALKIPVAFKDIDTTLMNTNLLIDVLQNDNLKGLSLQELTIVTQPKNGNISIINGRILFKPRFDDCGEIESFQYSIKTAEGRDTGLVCVYVKCGVFKIYNAFTPNKDGSNERFHIEGIELYPDNEVTIFNRWGNMVYTQSRFTNELGWDGTSSTQNDLPDGTYWYCVDLKNGKKFFGWVLVQR